MCIDVYCYKHNYMLHALCPRLRDFELPRKDSHNLISHVLFGPSVMLAVGSSKNSILLAPPRIWQNQI
jgi:hypothetical protein